MIDRIKLRTEMFKKKDTITKLANILNISRVSLSRKINSKCYFDEKEIDILTKRYGNIFFDYVCNQNSNNV